MSDQQDFFLEQSVKDGNSALPLSETHPHLASEANGWDPGLFFSGRASWKCQLGHVWETQISARKNVEGCPYCANKTILPGFNDLATTHPDLADSIINGDPTQIFAGSGRKYLWRCEKNHEWETSVLNRKKGRGCPYCSNQRILAGFNDLATTFPELAKEAHGWDPSTLSAGSSKGTKEWKCSEGHIWKARVHSRTEHGVMRGCPSCANYGFDPNKRAVLYLLGHPEWDLFKIGIANNFKNRLREHTFLGWELLDSWGPADGLLIYNWEQSILKYVKKSGGDFSALAVTGRTFTGWTECWTQKSFKISSIKSIMEIIQKDEND